MQAGDIVIIDGSAGRVIVHPTPATLAAYRERRRSSSARSASSRGLRQLPAVTRDGIADHAARPISSCRARSELAIAAGAEGIGLLRTEFLFMNRDDLPDEDEQYEALRAARATAWTAGR